MTRFPILALTVGLVLSASPGHAGTPLRKLGRGLANVTTGFLEVPGRIVEETRKRPPIEGTALGFVEGVGGIIPRELVGVYEVVTSPFPAPPDYRPILEPEFPWGHFDQPAGHH
jgi:putative exosortase-associated protein (TIGR04073 family)